MLKTVASMLFVAALCFGQGLVFPPANAGAGNFTGGTYEQFPPAAGFTYYVDPSGSDSNSGLSPATAWQTVSKVNGASLVSGQSVGFKSGGAWREQLTLTTNGITIGAYGTGALPLLDASDVISAGAWSLTSMCANTYQASVQINADPSVTWVSAWQNNGRLTRATLSGGCLTGAGTYFPSADTGSGTITITLYIHTAGGTNPGSDGNTYEYSHRQFGLSAESLTGTVVTNLHTRRNLHNDGSFTVGKSSVLTNVQASDGTKHNMLIMGNSVVNGCTIDNSYYAGQGNTMLVLSQASGLSQPGSISNCAFTSTDPTSFQTGSEAIISHTDDATRFGAVTISNTTIDGNLIGIAMGNVASVAMTSITSTGSLTASDTTPITITNCTVNVPSPGRVLDASPSNTQMTVNGGTYTGNASSAVPSFSLGGGSTISVTNATLVNTASDDIFVIAGGGISLTLNGSTLTVPSSTHFLESYTGFTYIGDNNSYSSVGNWVYVGSTKANLAAWQTATGQDSHSTTH